MDCDSNLMELVDERFAILDKLQQIKEMKTAVEGELGIVDSKIEAVIDKPVAEARKLAGKITGTVDVLVQGVMVKHNIPKKVEWDQEKLADVRKLILEHDDNPDEYMVTKTKTTYGVLEKKFKNFPPAVKAVFEEARTVKTSEPNVSFNVNWR